MPNRFAETVLASLEASKRQPFARVLHRPGDQARGRHHGGCSWSSTSRHSTNYERATEAEIAEVPGIGPVVAATVEQYLADSHNRETLAKLRAHGLRFVEEAPQRVEGPLSGKTFVLTGTLDTLSRTEAGERIVALGGKVASSVSSRTDYVVAGANPGSKLAKAQKAGVEIVDEQSFPGPCWAARPATSRRWRRRSTADAQPGPPDLEAGRRAVTSLKAELNTRLTEAGRYFLFDPPQGQPQALTDEPRPPAGLVRVSGVVLPLSRADRFVGRVLQLTAQTAPSTRSFSRCRFWAID